MLFADHVHNLRTVLDQLTWHLVAMHTGHDPAPVVAFPVLTSATRWEKAVKKQLRGFPPGYLEVIEWAQPYNVDPPSEHPAYYLHHLDIAGKHHRVVGFGLTLAQIPDPELKTNRPMGLGDRIQVEQSDGPFDLKEGEVLRRYVPKSPQGDLRIVGVDEMGQAQIVLGPYREDVHFPGSTAPMKNRHYVAFVGSVLEELKPAFEPSWSDWTRSYVFAL